jgi:hypothetical protein
MKKFALLAVILALPALAQEKPVTITGLVFGDYYYAVSHHDPVVEGKNGLWLRRAYLTFDKGLSDALSARLRFEVNQPGDFVTSSNMEPFVKDAFLRWRQSPKLDVLVGIVPSPGTETYERIWGYRPVEKSPLDLQRIVSTRDLGISLVGSVDDAKRYRYQVTAGNGSGTGAETNEEKRIGASFTVVNPATTFEVHAEHEGRTDADRSVLQFLAGYHRGAARAGVLVARQFREPEDVDVASLFATYDIRPNVTLTGRVDRVFDANPEAGRIPYLPMDPASKSTLFIAAADWKAHKNVSIIPNVEFVTYDDGEDDVLPRITLYFTF